MTTEREAKIEEVRVRNLEWAQRLSAGLEKVKTNLGIGRAVEALQDGHRVARAGWNGKGMYLELQTPDAHSKMSLPYVFMFTACENRVPWLCSQTDLLAQDWEIVS